MTVTAGNSGSNRGQCNEEGTVGWGEGTGVSSALWMFAFLKESSLDFISRNWWSIAKENQPQVSNLYSACKSPARNYCHASLATISQISCRSSHNTTSVFTQVTDREENTQTTTTTNKQTLNIITSTPSKKCNQWPVVTTADYSTHAKQVLRQNGNDRDKQIKETKISWVRILKVLIKKTWSPVKLCMVILDMADCELYSGTLPF